MHRSEIFPVMSVQVIHVIRAIPACPVCPESGDSSHSGGRRRVFGLPLKRRLRQFRAVLELPANSVTSDSDSV